MLLRGKRLLVVAVLLTLPSASARAFTADDAPIVSEDIIRFWSAYDRLATAATYEDTLRVLFEGYYLPASPGLRSFIRARIGSVIELVDAMNRNPRYYASIRASTLRVLEFEPSIRASFARWTEILPEAEFPSVYFVIGRMSSGGTTGRSTILIGTEMYGRTAETPEDELSDWHKDVLQPIDNLAGIVAHEMIHTQQIYADDGTLLAQCLNEGIADFLGEMISDENINAHVHDWADPREAELWNDFQQVMSGTDRAGWLYSRRAEEEPNDLGYWVGYKIAEAYYRNAADKTQAIHDMLKIEDFPAFLKNSAYGPQG